MPTPIIQRIVLNKLSAYAKIVDENGSFADDADHGLCHGFAFVHSAMFVVNKLPWWESALQAIMSWNEKPASLEKRVKLADKDQPTLSELFEYVTSYIRFNYLPNVLKNDENEDLEQIDLIDVFEVYDPVSKQYLKSSEHNSVRVVGTFTDEELIALLSPEHLKDNICVLGGNNHACAINYDGDFYFKDPNFSKKKSKSLSSLIPYIHGGVSQALSITLIDIKGKNSQGIEYFKKFPLLFRHLKGSGLLELSIKKSEWLDKALDLAKSSEEKSELIKALCKTNKKGYSALYGIIKDKPSLLEKIFNLVKTQEDKSTLIKAFCYLDKDGISLAHRLMKYAPEFVGDLFNLAVVPKDKSKLITVFSYVGEDKVCLAHRLMKYAPKFTNNLLNLATNPQDISTLIAAFSYLDEDGASLAYKYIGYEAEFAGKLLSLPMTPEDKTQLISVFSYINGDGVSPAHELMKYAPEFIGDLLNLAVAPKDKSKLITAFSYAGEDKVCLAHRLMKHAPEFIGDLLSLATNPKDKSKLIKSFCADGRETYNNILEKLINCEDEALLEQFLNLASTDEDRKAVISCFCRNTPCRFNFFKKRNRSLYEDIMVGKKFNFLQPFFIYNKFHSIFEYEDWEDLIYDDFFQKFLTIVNHSSIGQCVIGFGIYSLKDHELHDVVIALDKWGIDLASDKEVGFSEWNKLAKDSNFRYVLLLLDCLDINSNKVLANWQALKKDPIKAFFTIVGLGDQYAKYPNTLWHEFKYSYESLKEIDPDIYCDLDLGESEYTKKILKNPHKFYYSYKRLKDIKLNQTGYIGKIIENPESIDDIELNRYALLKLNKLGPVQQKDIDYVIREPEDFNKRCSYLEKIKSIHSYIDKRSEKLKKIYGGEEIKKSNTEIKVKVATGISQIWNEITDDKGEFNVKYSNSISIYKKIGSILKERRQKKFHTIFLRDEFTKRAYNNIGTVAKNLDLSRV